MTDQTSVRVVKRDSSRHWARMVVEHDGSRYVLEAGAQDEGVIRRQDELRVATLSFGPLLAGVEPSVKLAAMRAFLDTCCDSFRTYP